MRRLVSERPAVLLLHASGSSARQWQALVERLQPRYRPLAVDLRGPEDAAQVTEALERLGGAHLVGHSYGGALAMTVAARRPALVCSLAAYEPVLFRALLADGASGREAQDVLVVAETIRLLLSRNEPEAAAQRFVEYWSGADAWRYLAPGRQAAIAARMPEVLGNFDTLLDKPFDAPGFARLRRPMLFLTGGSTVASTRRLGMLLGEAFPMAQHDTMPGLGHMGPVTHAESVNERIEKFLDACETDARHSITVINGKRHGSGNHGL
jgi:pimeloyl-ACP methyl ester carboxylesterase